MAHAEGWVNIATCSMHRWRGDLKVIFFPRYHQRFLRSAIVIQLEAGGCGPLSGREGVPVGGRSWISC